MGEGSPFTTAEVKWFKKGDRMAKAKKPAEDYPGQEKVQTRDQLGRDFAGMQAALDKDGNAVPMKSAKETRLADIHIEAVGENLPDNQQTAAGDEQRAA